MWRHLIPVIAASACVAPAYALEQQAGGVLPAQHTTRWSDGYSVPAAPTAAAPAAPQGDGGAVRCVAGQAVSVLHGGQWYPAKILSGPDRAGTCLVSYDGHGSNWDEWVSSARMRAPAGQDAARPAPAAGAGAAAPTAAPDEQRPPAAGAPRQVPAGKYSCYTFDGGQLNYTYTDVVIAPDGRYSVGGQGGRYTLAADGTLRFAGTMANATGRFSVKNGGKPQIDLVFDGDARASMACPKSS